MNNRENHVKQLFEESNIKPSLWFTKYGYYLLYGQPRFLLSFVFQIVEVLLGCSAAFHLMQIVFLGRRELLDALILLMSFSCGAGALSDLFLFDMTRAIRNALLSLAVAYVYLNFL